MGTLHMIIMNRSIGMEKTSKIYVAGHRGMVGSAIVRRLKQQGYSNLVLRTRAELELTRQAEVEQFFQEESPEYVFVAAARVGGIRANNTYRAEFIYQNLMIESNLIHTAWKKGVKRLLFLGSSCIYPRNCPQPILEEYLLTSALEQTNEPYALAKIAGLKLCENYNRQYGTSFFSLMPTNMYGPNDNYDLNTGHVLPALIRKAHEAKMRQDLSIPIWGTGTAKREFLYVDDLADAAVFMMESGIQEGVYNVGTGEDVTIRELAELVIDVVGFRGTLAFDATQPEGTLRKVLNVDKMKALGWQAKTALREGIALAYADFLKQTEKNACAV